MSKVVLSSTKYAELVHVDITITLTYIRPIQNPTTGPPSPNGSYESFSSDKVPDLVIDTQAPLLLRSSK